MVSDKYRRDLSAVNSENQVAELFCEIALCASLANRAQKLELRPSTGKGTYSDCLFNLSGFDIYGEAKRYVDPWPHIERIGDSTNVVFTFFWKNPRADIELPEVICKELRA